MAQKKKESSDGGERSDGQTMIRESEQASFVPPLSIVIIRIVNSSAPS